MNHGFKSYLSGGFRASVKTMYKNKNILLVWLYTVLSFIGKVTIIFAPIFYLADVRHAKLVHAENHVHIAQNFRVACRAKALLAYYGAIFLEIMIAIAGLVLIGIGTGILALISMAVSLAAPNFPTIYMLLIFCAPGALVALAYLTMIPVYFAPTAYIIETNPGISAAATVSACVKSMRRCGKWTCFFNTFLPVLGIAVVGGIFAGANYLCDTFIQGLAMRVIAEAGLSILAILAMLFIYPIMNMARQVAQKSLFEDISLDPINASKHTSGVNIQRCKGVLFEPETIEENLSMLFDETKDESVPLPTSNARTKHEQAARMGEEKVDLSQQEDEVYYDNSDRQEQS